MIFVVGTDPDLERRLEASGESIHRFSEPVSALAALAEGTATADVLVLSLKDVDPERPLRRLRELDSDLGVLVVCEAGREELLEGSLSLLPRISEDVQVGRRGAADLDQAVRDMAARTRTRRRHARTVAAVRDQLAQIEAPPRLSAAMLGRLLDHAPIGVVTCRSDGAVIGLNQLAVTLLEVDEPADALSLDNRFAENADELRDLLDSGLAGPASARFGRTAADGSLRWFEISVAPLPFSGGVRELLVLLADVTDSAEAQATLHTRTEQQERVIDLGGLALVSSDQDLILDRAAGAVATGLRVDLVSVLELPEDGDDLVLRAARGWPVEAIGTRFPRSNPRIARTLSEERPIVVDDAQADPGGAPQLAAQGAVSGITVPVRTQTGPIGVIGAHSRKRRRFSATDISFVQEVAHIVGGTIQWERTRSALEESERHREEVIAALLRAEDEERARVATDLHDDTVQVLAAALLHIDRVGRLVASQPAAEAALAQLRDTLHAAMDRTRALMFGLRPAMLEAQGIGAAIAELANQTAADTDAIAHVSCPDERYPDQVETIVFRTVREALTNIQKHAQATEFWIDITTPDRELVGSILDDGRGFDPTVDRAHAHLHMGLDAIRERVVLAGGDLDIMSAPGAGTEVRFRLPLRPDEDAEFPDATDTAVSDAK